MPLTQAQANDKYIIDSVAFFLNKTVKSYYDAAALASETQVDGGFPKPLKIRMGTPDDPDVVLNSPVVAINVIEASNRRRGTYGVGTAEAWRPMSFVFYCYPGLSPDGRPNLSAQMALRTAMRNSLGGETVRVVDFGNPANTMASPTYTGEVMYIDDVNGPMNRGQKTAIAQERHRFDMHMHVSYVVFESLAN